MIFRRTMKTAATTLTAAILPAAVLAWGVLAWGAPANASELNLSTWNCKQFQSASKDEVSLILAWLDGYYRDEDDPPVIDTNQLAANAKKLGAYCTAHPDTKLITAADTLFERE
jgi:acid stress chaperone HdeB